VAVAAAYYVEEVVNDSVLDALDGLVRALRANSARIEATIARAERIREQREEGLSYREIESGEERPLIAFILRNREKLDLSAAQVKNLEQLRNDFQKESIRKDADLRVAEMDLNGLLVAEKVDMAKVEAKVREIERLRSDLRIARIRTIQKGKEVLTADQRKKLQELLAEQQIAGLQSRSVY